MNAYVILKSAASGNKHTIMRYILTTCLAIACVLMAFRSSQDIIVRGFVKDQNGLPIANVTVAEKQKHKLTQTGGDGSFSLEVSGKNAVLVFIAVGYEKQEVRVNDDGKPLNIVLNPSASRLNEVVVMGYSDRKAVADETEAEPAVRNYNNNLPSAVSGLYVQKQKSGNGDVMDKKYFPQNNSTNEYNTEEYDGIIENRFLTASDNPLSTFSIDVDGGSCSNVRRFLQQGQMPPAGAVRIEELINYFHYDYPQPTGADPFSINTELGECAWNPKHKLVMIGLQGKKIPIENLPASNLVFLIDVSGSMMQPEKLPLVQSSLSMLVDQLREQDRVSLVVYAGNAGLVMPSTSGSEKIRIKDAINRLEAGGSTAGGAGIQLAYKIAGQHFVKGGNNRVILCTDGDFNVGPSSNASLEELIDKERKTGVFLTVLGYGMGNYKDSKMEKLADMGNGNHAYIDNEREARKVLVNEFGGTLFTIAKDVKLQIEFNPAKVQAYRLIGYENRMLNKEDFNNDLKDAGELGSGHTVTALYEIIPVGVENEFLEKIDPLKYQQFNKPLEGMEGTELLTIKFRYKAPDGEKSMLIRYPVLAKFQYLNEGSVNFRFVSAVAQFGMLLRNSEFKQQATYNSVYALGKNALGKDTEGYRAEFLKLVMDAGKIAIHESMNEEEDVSRMK